MRSFKLTLLATAAFTALTSASAAADLISSPPAIFEEEPVIDNSFSWDGAYIGAFVQGQTAPEAFGLGVDLGVNVLMDSILIGAEIEAVASTDNNYSAQITGRVGGLVSEGAILYAFSGAGSRTDTSWYVPVGVGAEFAVADNVGLKTEVQYNFDLTDQADNSVAAKVGLNFHF